MKKALLFVLAVASLALIACSSVKSGYVIEKKYTPDRHYTERVSDYNYVCFPITKARTSYDSEGNPTTTYVIEDECNYRYVGSHTEQRYDPPIWRLKLRSDDDPEKSGWVEVGQQEYENKYDIGYHYPDLR